MSEMNSTVKLAVDAYHGSVEKYSVSKSQEVLREALIAANNGKTCLDFKAIRDGKCTGLFALLEEILALTVNESLVDDNEFMALVDYRNIPEGDENKFIIEDSTLFEVSDTADGTQAVRRQRLSGRSHQSISTSMHTVRIYEELNRVLSGRVDFNHFIDVVADSFHQKIVSSAYELWMNATADDLGGVKYFPVGGSYDEDTLLDLIADVEAAAGGKPATIVGTKKALRVIKDTIQSETTKNDKYNMGYVGKFYGTPVVALTQRNKAGSTDHLYKDNMLTIIAGDQKPIKFVYEGDPLVLMGNPTDNMDLTQEYFYGEKYGLGIVMAGGNSGIGRYDIA